MGIFKNMVLLKTMGVAILGGAVANIIHLPVPWLLGSLLAVLIATSLGMKLYWPNSIRDAGIIIVGYSMGLSFTRDALALILLQLPSIFFNTVLIILFTAGLAYILSKAAKLDYPSVLIGSIPGGLSQMILLAEEVKGINVAIVTVLQVSRLMLIVIFVPLLVFSPFVEREEVVGSVVVHSPEIRIMDVFPSILLFIPIIIFSILIAKKLRLPTPFLVGPIFGTTIVGLLGYEGPALPSSILDLSQLMIGTHVGLLITLNRIDNKLKLAGVAIAGGVLLLLGSWGLSWVLSYQKGLSSATSILSLAPGGLDQMGIIATAIHADLSVVSGYQLFRLFFIFFIVPPILRVFIQFLHKKEKMGSVMGGGRLYDD